MSTKQARQIIHVDMDAFYASVEQRDQPELRNRPVIVGGSRTRGVVSACSYEARAFGVRSAMPLARAVQLCPEAAVLPVRMEAYKAVSRKIFAIFRQFTDRVEPLSIDEAFLDVTGCERLLSEAGSTAQKIRASIPKQVALAVSDRGGVHLRLPVTTGPRKAPRPPFATQSLHPLLFDAPPGKSGRPPCHLFVPPLTGGTCPPCHTGLAI